MDGQPQGFFFNLAKKPAQPAIFFLVNRLIKFCKKKNHWISIELKKIGALGKTPASKKFDVCQPKEKFAIDVFMRAHSFIQPSSKSASTTQDVDEICKVD